MTIIDRVAEFVRAEGTYMSVDEYEDNDIIITIATRENGDVGEEEFSEKDWEEAARLEKALKKEFGSLIQTAVEPCDEWVHIEVFQVL